MITPLYLPMSPKVAANVVNILIKPATEPASLSPREHAPPIVQAITGKKIACCMQVSIHNTSMRTRNLFTKLNVQIQAAAVARALKDRLV